MIKNVLYNESRLTYYVFRIKVGDLQNVATQLIQEIKEFPRSWKNTVHWQHLKETGCISIFKIAGSVSRSASDLWPRSQGEHLPAGSRRLWRHHQDPGGQGGARHHGDVQVSDKNYQHGSNGSLFSSYRSFRSGNLRLFFSWLGS